MCGEGAINSDLPTDKPHTIKLEQIVVRHGHFITTRLFKYACTQLFTLSLHFFENVFKKFIYKHKVGTIYI